jgi:hypothetical protein
MCLKIYIFSSSSKSKLSNYIVTVVTVKGICHKNGALLENSTTKQLIKTFLSPHLKGLWKHKWRVATGLDNADSK